METSTIVLVIVLAVIVLVIVGMSIYCTYRLIKKEVEGYNVNTHLNFNLHELETMDGIVNNWLDTPVFGMECERYEAQGNDGTDDNLFKDKKISVTVGDFGLPHAMKLTTTDQRLVIMKSGTKSIVLLCRLKDETKMSNVYFTIVLEGCPNGVSDFTLDELKKFPSKLHFKWNTRNKIAQAITWVAMPLTTNSSHGNMVNMYTEPGKDSKDQNIRVDVNLIL